MYGDAFASLFFCFSSNAPKLAFAKKHIAFTAYISIFERFWNNGH